MRYAEISFHSNICKFYYEGVYTMNKKEVLEIRKQFTPENCAITRICGCYVDHEKEKKTELKKAFHRRFYDPVANPVFNIIRFCVVSKSGLG